MTKTVHDLPDEWKKTMLDLYAAGASDTEVRAELEVTPRLWNRLMMTDPSFEEVVLYGKTLCLAWWMRQGRTNLDNRGFNAQLYNINMQNRFNWSSKGSTVEGDEADDSNEEDIDRQITELMESQNAAKH